mmetsp:Transcript_120558/g.257452  ORF Transcript_120558/g.257452 Transcript_120558/m.257452 type:complete len:161 (-) Transcript_120558:51-533(-)
MVNSSSIEELTTADPTSGSRPVAAPAVRRRRADSPSPKAAASTGYLGDFHPGARVVVDEKVKNGKSVVAAAPFQWLRLLGSEPMVVALLLTACVAAAAAMFMWWLGDGPLVAPESVVDVTQHSFVLGMLFYVVFSVVSGPPVVVPAEKAVAEPPAGGIQN